MSKSFIFDEVTRCKDPSSFSASNDNKDNATSTVSTLQIPKPRRNSIDLTSNGDNNSLKVEDAEKATLKFDNQLNEYTLRRWVFLASTRFRALKSF